MSIIQTYQFLFKKLLSPKRKYLAYVEVINFPVLHSIKSSLYVFGVLSITCELHLVQDITLSIVIVSTLD